VLKHIPNAITSLNLVCGCLSIIAALNGELGLASLYIGAAAVLDFFDGFAARALKAYSETGKQLDSLADMVSFGVAPGMILYALAGQCYAPSGLCINMYLPFLVPVFSAIRLANFNIDTRQSDSFIGVPTPANAIFIASIPLIMAHDTFGIAGLFTNHYFLILFPFLSAYMLVAELPLLALKFKSYGWNGNAFRWILIGTSVLSVVMFQYLGIALAILLYILISIIHNLTQKNTHEI
jgi:CDP-diacylglycerol---serine O-phosphatidyltransferase